MIRPQDLPTQMAKTFQVKLMVWLAQWKRGKVGSELRKLETILRDVPLVCEPSQAKCRAE
jgi:hypothetical protein